MDKFFGYSGLICFCAIYIMINIEYFFYDGDIHIYILCVMMGDVFLWFDYKMKLTNVTRHIVHYEDKNDTQN